MLLPLLHIWVWVGVVSVFAEKTGGQGDGMAISMEAAMMLLNGSWLLWVLQDMAAVFSISLLSLVLHSTS